MELQLLENIKKFGYNGELTEATKFMESLKQGQKSPAFTKLVAWIADEIAILNDMDETIHSIVSPDDSSSFLLELSCFLKELGCMNERLMTGNVNERLGTEQDRFALLDFLAAELAASRLIEARNQKASTSMDIEVEESDTAKDLKDMLVALNFEKPPDNITAEKLFSRLEAKLTEVLKTAPRELVGEPLVTNEFTEREWKDLELVQQELHDEYRMRRDMLLKRLDVTVQSFLWSDRVKSREAELTKQYEETRKFLSAEPNITFADLLAARDDIAIMEKTSNASVRKNTRSEINSIIIGEVPDRGGRPYEQEPPPPEMPPWQKDRVPGPSPAGGGRGGGRGGGGYGGGGGGRGGGYKGIHGGGTPNTSSSDSRGSFGSGNSNRGGGYGGGFGDNKVQGSNSSSNSGGYGGQGGGYGGKQGGGYSGGQGGGQSGGYGGGKGGGYGGQGGGYGGQGAEYSGSQSGRYSGGQGGRYGGGNNSYNTENRDGGYGQRYSAPQSEAKGGQQYQRGGGSGRGREGGRVQGGWNQGNNSDNYQRGGYNRGGGRGERQY
ncbi:protein FAM98A isoform X2 [Andrena cerasifolii]|uniref:protein FAM98A isoform X2 n=1 Tax=Andrena cerasifolii TaxID=2819439 RepID=UPI004037AA91